MFFSSCLKIKKILSKIGKFNVLLHATKKGVWRLPKKCEKYYLVMYHGGFNAPIGSGALIKIEENRMVLATPLSIEFMPFINLQDITSVKGYDIDSF